MNRKFAIPLLLLWLMSTCTWADGLVVVAHPDSQVSHLDHAQLINIYMGRYRQLPTGEAALPVDVGMLKERFYRALLNKGLAEVNSYWARLVFSGQVSPPLQLQTPAQVLDYIRRNPGALGYLSAADVPDDLLIVARLDEASAE
jgi:ABC-type phosphate transport system substrate-binding protein